MADFDLLSQLIHTSKMDGGRLWHILRSFACQWLQLFKLLMYFPLVWCYHDATMHIIQDYEPYCISTLPTFQYADSRNRW